MVLFAIIVIFDHYYKFCDVFKVKFERIRNIPKPNVIVKIRNFIPKLPVFPAYLRTRLLNIQTQLRDVTKLFYMCRCGVAMFLIRKHAFSYTY